jgi:dTDP-4-dehydrorhamnose reductase
MKRILIVGASGLVGSNLAMALRDDHCVYGTYHSNRFQLKQVPLFHVDVLKETALFDVLMRIRPEVVFYCAAIRDEGTCTTNALHALTVNAEAAADIALCLRPMGGKLIYFSSAKVFSGQKGNYTEEDTPDPNSSYGSAKLRAEEMLLEFENAFTLRVGTLFGFGPRLEDGLLPKLLRQLWSGADAHFISDEHRTFQSVQDVVEGAKRLMQVGPEMAGVYHCPGGGRATYFDFARLLARTLGLAPDHLHPLPGAQLQTAYNTAEIRGRDTSLNAEKFSRSLGGLGHSLEESLQSVRSQLVNGEI